MGAKQTSQLIPLCHNIPLDKVSVELTLDSAQQCVRIEAMATTQAYTGQMLLMGPIPGMLAATEHAKSAGLLWCREHSKSCHAGVEMEAMVGASVAALTVYDMCKALDKGITIKHVQLETKTGGKSGDYHRSLGTV